MARPSKYIAAVHNDWAWALCAVDDATDKDIARAFGVNENTINQWKKKHPEFRESLKEGKASTDARVSRKLSEKALGYRVETTRTTRKIRKDADGRETQDITQVTTETVIPPDTTAIIWWQKNRDPERWRDKQGDPKANEEAIRDFLEKVRPSPADVAALFKEE